MGLVFDVLHNHTVNAIGLHCVACAVWCIRIACVADVSAIIIQAAETDYAQRASIARIREIPGTGDY